MFVIDRSFQFWKEPKVSALAQKVLRSIKHNEAFDISEKNIRKLEEAMLVIDHIKQKPFASKLEIRTEVNEKAKGLIKALLKIADAVEKKAEYKSDMVLAGFHPGRIQRSPRYVKKKKKEKA